MTVLVQVQVQAQALVRIVAVHTLVAVRAVALVQVIRPGAIQVEVFHMIGKKKRVIKW